MPSQICPIFQPDNRLYTKEKDLYHPNEAPEEKSRELHFLFLLLGQAWLNFSNKNISKLEEAGIAAQQIFQPGIIKTKLFV